MSLTLENAAGQPVTYSVYRFAGNRATYRSPASSDLVQDEIIISTQDPARAANSYGNRRSSVNMLRTHGVPVPNQGEEVVKTIKFDLITSIPSGLAEAEVDEFIARMAALLGQPAVLKQIVVSGQTQV